MDYIIEEKYYNNYDEVNIVACMDISFACQAFSICLCTLAIVLYIVAIMHYNLHF